MTGRATSELGSERRPYVVLLGSLAQWLRETIGRADPKCPLCEGEGTEECEACDGDGRLDCTCADCGNEHETECEACGGTGSLRCRCVEADDPSFRVELCGRVLGYRQARELLRALEGAKGEYARVWVDSYGIMVHVSEVSRRTGRVRWTGPSLPPVIRPAPPRYPVEQAPLPLFGDPTIARKGRLH